MRLIEECDRKGMSIDSFMKFQEAHNEILDSFRNTVYQDDYKIIRDNKKLHFWMDSGTIKISTINSFKGWESEVLFLILEPKYDVSTSFNMAFDELLYTGITRCRNNLVVLNYGNAEYDYKIGKMMKEFRSTTI